MAKDPNHLTGLETENTGGLLSGFLAEEDEFDRRSMWRLGAWGLASMGAVVFALYVNQSSIGLRRDQVAAADLVRQSQQIQSVAKENQNEARRLTSAIDTLNGDRDRLYSRLTVLEQGLDSVTGTIARQKPVAASPQAAPPSSTPPPPATLASSTPSPVTPSPVTTSPSTTSPVTTPPSTTSPVTTSALTPPSATPAAPPEPSPMAQNPSPPPVASPVPTPPAKTAEKPTTNAPLESHPAAISSPAQAASLPPAAPSAISLMPSKSIMAPPDPAAAKLIEPEKPMNAVSANAVSANAASAAPVPEMVASVAPAASADLDGLSATVPKMALQRTEFGVDVGGANSLPGLRALWRGLLKSRSNAPLAALHPIIVVRESSTGLGMQLRLVAGPLSDAAAAAKICAAMIEGERTCEATVFDGQRLAMNVEEPPASAAKPVSSKPAIVRPARRRSFARRVTNDPPVNKPEPTTTTLSSFLGIR
jgi:hypothetical protein